MMIILDFCTIKMRENNILQINIKKNVEVCVDEIKIMLQNGLKLTNNKKVPVIIYIGEFGSFSKEARAYSANPKNETLCSCIAYITENLSQKIIINFYLKINKPQKPIKIFKDEFSALQWISQISNQLE